MTTTREEEIDWQHVAKHGLAKVTPEHTWAEWLADRNAEIERLEAEITRLRSASQAGGVPAGWMDMADAPRTRPIIVLTAGGRIIKAKWVIIGDDAVGWGTPDEDDPHPNCWHTGFCWASNEDEEPSDPPVGWIEIPSASPPPPATDGDALEKLRDAAERAVKIIKTNLYHQREKVEDAASILRDAIASVPTPVSATDAVEAEREKVAFFNVVVCGALQWFEDHRVALQKVGSGTIPQWVLDGWALKAAIRARGTDEVENG